MNWVDIISLVTWGLGAAVGLVAGFIRIWPVLAFALGGTGIGGTIGYLVGPGFFGFVDSEEGRIAAAFLLVFALMVLLGAVVTHAMRGPLSIASALTAIFPLGGLLNHVGDMLGGTLLCCVFVSVILIALQQLPVPRVADALQTASIAYGPMGWVDRYVASIEISLQ